MVKKKEEEKVLDVNATMQGTLKFSDPVKLRINGKFEGALTTKGTLLIGEDAHVTADIIGENISISGWVKGNVRATKMIELKSTAVMLGDMETSFNGKSRMSEEKMSLDELSEYLSIDEDKIMEWVNGGRIPVERQEEGLMFDRQEVETWIGRNV